jgi:hypothetical protein
VTVHYHGTPISPNTVLRTLEGRYFCVSWARRDQVKIAHELGAGVMLDNGAFSFWRKKGRGRSDWPDYYRWCEKWFRYETTWAVIPDVIDGTVEENDYLVDEWPHGYRGSPVWHLNEPLRRLTQLALEWPRVCIGSSGQYAVIGTPQWHRRMADAMDMLCCFGGKPLTSIHMLRGMGQVDGPYPFASVDSTDIGRNHNRPQNTAAGMAARWASMHSPPRWHRCSSAPGLSGSVIDRRLLTV